MITTLINEHLINLDLKATRKEEVFTEMARLLASQGKVSDEQAFIKDSVGPRRAGQHRL